MLLADIEARAQNGFHCRIGLEKFLMFPRLGAMSLDTPERVKYFCLARNRACGYCRLRQGRSVTRAATRHDPVQLSDMFTRANVSTQNRDEQRQRKRARQKLSRHGWKSNKRCRLTDKADKCLVHVSLGDDVPPPYAGLIQFEKMHTFFINYCTYCLDQLSQCVPKESYKIVAEGVNGCYQFRDPITGRTHPRLTTVLKMTHLTAERRVRAIFYWAHVLGTNATCIYEDVCAEAQAVVASLQLLLIATRGHRAYTESELDMIFGQMGREFFRNLEAIAQFTHDRRIARAKTDTTPFEPTARCVYLFIRSYCCV
jgi:hypothetical protein